MPLPVTLTIAGSDNSAGAGIQADLKTFSELDTYGLTAITCVVAEIPGLVESIAAVPLNVIAGQVRLSLEAYPVAALKTGMLYSRPVIETVAEILHAIPPERRPAIVVDPVMIATSGDALLEPGAVEAYQALIFPLATVVTPNLDETAALIGRALTSLEAMRTAGEELVARYGRAFLLKGGHLAGEEAVDLLLTPDGKEEAFVSPRIPSVATHGTGCTFSAAITAGLARGLSLREAVALGKEYITGAIARPLHWPTPCGTPVAEVHALNHFHPRFTHL